jgi:hypothetical protein
VTEHSGEPSERDYLEGLRRADKFPPAEHLHTIPIDPSLTVDEAWHELCLMGARATTTGQPTWATVECDGDECQNIATERDPA